MRVGIKRAGEPVEGRLLWLTLRQQLLTPPLRLKLLGLLSDARLFVKPPPLQFAEESFPRKFFLAILRAFSTLLLKTLISMLSV